MPSVPLRVLIVLFWLATTSFVVVREWLPRLGTGAIQYNQLLANRAVDEHSADLVYVRADPVFANFRAEPRFVTVLHHIRLPDDR